MNDMLKNVITWGIILLVLMSIFNHYSSVGTAPDELTYSDFLNNVRNGTVAEVNISSTPEGNTIKGLDVNGKEFHTFGMPDPRLVDDLVENNVEISAEPPEKRSVILDLLINIIPVLLLVGLWVYFMRQMQGGG
ncbi:MAG: ATP-dependent metallopeptidase FtsH/Yme1/Tma family protein, partial [Gammaproteobacteria bacterium]|nr:ATP-dependent metallopeptidase FtsH/Yme1/Tma family protein [Gammaproteobacteria bacterium]